MPAGRDEGRHDGDGRPAPASEPAPPSFFQSDNVWVLIPLAALAIPILAITLNSEHAGPVVAAVVAVVAVVAAVTLAARNLLAFRHRLRIEEVEAKERLALAERERFTAAERILEGEGMPPLARPSEAERVRREPPAPPDPADG